LTKGILIFQKMPKPKPVSEFLVPCSAVNRTIYITSGGALHGIIGLWCSLRRMTEEERQDVCEEILEEGFFCGYDFYDDWYPLLSRISIQDLNAWLDGNRGGILFDTYEPSEYFGFISSGYNHRRVWSYDTSIPLQTKQISEKIIALWGQESIVPYHSLGGWDAILGRNGKPEILVDAYSFPWIDNPNVSFLFTERKLKAIQSVAQAYSLRPVIVVYAFEKILWADAMKFATMGRSVTPGMFPSGMPSDDETMVNMELSKFRPLSELTDFFQEIQNVDV